MLARQESALLTEPPPRSLVSAVNHVETCEKHRQVFLPEKETHLDF